MIKLEFNLNREMMKFRIENKEIYYNDRVWQNEIRCIPQDPNFIQKIRDSRNRFSNKLIQAFSLSKKQKEEYENARDDKELAKIIIKDMGRKGGKLLSLHET